jgi:hypothetical protein
MPAQSGKNAGTRRREVGDIVNRAYGNVRGADAKRAEATLLRANPQLEKLRDVKPGAVMSCRRCRVCVPPTSTARTRRRRSRSARCEACRKQLGANIGDEKASVGALSDLLNSKEVKTLVRDLPETPAHVERVTSAA